MSLETKKKVKIQSIKIALVSVKRVEKKVQRLIRYCPHAREVKSRVKQLVHFISICLSVDRRHFIIEEQLDFN